MQLKNSSKSEKKSFDILSISKNTKLITFFQFFINSIYFVTVFKSLICLVSYVSFFINKYGFDSFSKIVTEIIEFSIIGFPSLSFDITPPGI